MPSLPGSKLWESALMGYVITSSQRTSFDTGGVIEFDDGTLWSYESGSPDGPRDYPEFWIHIAERKPGSDAWVRLVPDKWGEPSIDTPPNYPKWPNANFTDSEWRSPGTTDFSGPLNVGHIGRDGEDDWQHVQDGDDVWFYPRTGGSRLGPVKVNRHTRIWQRYLTSSDSADTWGSIASNVVIVGPYMYFLAHEEV